MNNRFRTILTCLLLTLSSISFADNVNENNLRITGNEVNKRIDINLADIQTLSLLKGVGTKKAAEIIKYRETHGKFTSVDGLLNVSGIGKQVLAINKEKLTI